MSMTANSQRGVALLTILLLVVSITVVAGSMLASQKLQLGVVVCCSIKISCCKISMQVNS